jgi:sensor histidine kinase regulating citrate/malate metabolism
VKRKQKQIIGTQTKQERKEDTQNAVKCTHTQTGVDYATHTDRSRLRYTHRQE